MKSYVYINSSSGAGYGYKYYTDYLKQFLNDNFNEIHIVNIPCEEKEYNIPFQENKDENSIFIVGGDGTVSMTIDKILKNSNFEELKIPICICPFGSGNGLAKNLNIDPYNLPIDKIKKFISPMNTSYSGENNLSFLSQTWGIISDIDINTEYLRMIGDLRYYYGIAKSIILPKYYKGKCKITDSQEFTIEINDNFLFFCASNAPWISEDFKIAPLSNIYNKEIDILLIKKELSFLERLKLIYYLSCGNIHTLDFVEYFKAKKYTLEINDNRSFIVSDGEKLLSSEISAEISDKKFLFYCNE